MISPIGKKKVNNAFTLIEILLVIVIVGIILALAAPNFSQGYSRLQLKQTADDLLNMSRWAQAMSVGQARIYALSFSRDRHSYGLLRAKVPLQNEETGNIEDTDLKDTFEPVTGRLGAMHVIPDAIRLHTQANRIEFYPDGTIDPATIELDTSRQKILLSSAEVQGMMTEVDSE